MMCGHVSLSKKNDYPLLPNLSLPKNFFQITLNKGHPHTKGWHNICICFIWMVVHQYKNIYKNKEKNKWLYQENKRKRKAKGEQEEVKQILNETLFKDPYWNNSHITCLGFYFHLHPYP